MAKKKKGSKKNKGAPASFSDDSDSDSQSDDEEAMPKLQRDRSLEAMFVDIPKDAIAPIPALKKKGDEGPDPEAVFGLSGDVARLLKKATWASMVLLVLTLVVVRSPLMSAFRPDDSVELAKKEERAELDRQGKSLPGIRPFPSLQATQEEVDAAGGSNVKVVEDLNKAEGKGIVVNIGNGQKIKVVKKKAQAAPQAPPPQAP